MDILVIACIVLVITNVVFAILAFSQRRLASRIQAQFELSLARAGEHRKLAYNDGLFDGYKRGWSESYTAACKALRNGSDPAEAIHRVGKLNAPALLVEKQEKIAA